MLKRFLFFCALVLGLTTVSQVVAEILEGPRGPVEFVGLEEWTASELFEAIKETDPDNPFHACAAVMIRELKFPDAAAFGFFKKQEDGSMKLYTVVVGVEDVSHVQYRTAGSEALELPETWQELQTTAADSFQTVSAAVYVHYLLTVPDTASQLAELSDEEAEETAHQIAEMFGSSPEMIDRVSTFIDNNSEDTDFDLALEVLEKAESWSARFVAAIVLAQFPENDESWHNLADSLIDPAMQVRQVASKLLQGLVRAEQAVPVQWLESRETLLALIGGTYAFAFNDILDVLVATEIDSEFARELVQQRPKLLLGFVGADHDEFRESAHVFLKTISGEDFDRDIEAWEELINGWDSVP